MIDGQSDNFDRVVEWGRSGPYSPCVVPDGAGAEQLRAIQEQIKSAHPDADLSCNLALPFFSFDPQLMYEKVVADVMDNQNTHDPELREFLFYRDMISIVGNLVFGYANFSMDVEGLERDDNTSSVSVRLGRCASFDYLADKAQLWLPYSLTKCKYLSKDDVGIMRDDSELGCAFDKPEPRIIIATGLGAAAISDIQMPDTLHFTEIDDGNPHFNNPDGRLWYRRRL